jgi:hypothetical protein
VSGEEEAGRLNQLVLNALVGKGGNEFLDLPVGNGAVLLDEVFG